jgi:hypothetical protein
VAQGQLFAHGHLSQRTALELAARNAVESDRGDGGKTQCCKALVWPRLATPH